MRTRLVHLTGRALLVVGVSVATLGSAASASAAEAPVSLGNAAAYAILGGSTITNTGPTVISGDVGLSPGSAVTGFPPATFTSGTMRSTADAAAAQQDDTIAFNDAAGRSSSGAVVDVGGLVLTPGVYTASSTLGVTGTVTLDAQGDPSAVFIFQAGTSLTTASGSVVALVNGATSCNVFWQVGSSATLGTGSLLRGTVLAQQSITATTGAEIEGRLLAANAAVTLDTNRITVPVCTATAATTVATPAATATTTDATAAAVPADTTAAAPAAPSTTATTARPAAGTSTATGRTPTLPRTGSNPLLAFVAALLILLGTALLWIGRPLLAHARR